MSTQTLQPTEVHSEPVLAAQVDLHCAANEIPGTIASGFGTLMGFAARQGVGFGGAPRVIYTGMAPGGVDMTLAIPVTGTPVGMPPVRVAELPAADTLRFTHIGPYDRLMETYNEITGWMVANGRMQSEADWARYMPMWEEYPNDPQTTPPEQLITYIHLPVV